MRKIFRISFLLFFFFLFFESKAATYYWIGGTGSWSDLSHWATTSGGTTNPASLPGSGDNVIFDANSFSAAGQIVTLSSGSTSCKTMNWSTALFTPTFSGGSGDTLSVYGSLVFATSMNNLFNGNILFLSPFTTDTIKTNNIPLLGDVAFSSAGTWNLRSDLTVNGTLYFQRGTLRTNSYQVSCSSFSSVSTYTRNLQPFSSLFTISGSGTAWSAGTGNFSVSNAGDWKISFNYSGNDGVIFNSGGSTIIYNIIEFQNSNAEIYREGSMDSLLLTPGMTLVVPSLKTQTVSMITANGTCALPITIKASSTSVATFNRSAAGTISTDYLRLTNINKSGSGTFIATNSIIESGTSNWTVTGSSATNTYYWTGGTGSWSDPAHWSTTSGGAGGTCIPGPTDDVVFDANSFTTLNDVVTIDVNAYCNDMTWSNASFVPDLAGSDYILTIGGSLELNNLPMTSSFNGEIVFNSTVTETINSNGINLNAEIYFKGTGGQWNLASDLFTNETIYLEEGSFATQNFNVSCGGFNSDYSSARTLTLGSSLISITGDGDSWNVSSAGFTFSYGTSVIQFDNTGLNTCNFIGDGLTYYDLIFNNSITSITGANTFRILKVAGGNTLILESGTTQTIDSIIWNGSCDAPVTVEASSVFGSAANISKSGHTIVNVDNIYLRNITASVLLPVRIYNATNSSGSFTTTGWTITNSITSGKKYWIGGTGNWSDINHWSASSGGAPGACLPSASDTVIFDGNSFSAANQVVTVDVDGYCKVIDWSAATNTPELLLVRNVIVSHYATLNSDMTVERYNRTAALQFIPELNNVYFDSKKTTLATDVLFYGFTLTDTLELLDHLYLSDTNSFTMIRGTFVTNNDSINAGAITFLNNYTKTVQLGSSFIDLTYGWNSFTAGTMLLNSGTSVININGHTSFDYFYGDGFTYNSVIISSPSDTNTFMTGSNIFNDLQLNPGVDLVLSSGSTQSVLNNFTATGTCADSITLESSADGVAAIINKASGTVTTECLSIKDITRSGAATFNTLFSTNLGNVTGFNFIATNPADAGFTTSDSICLGDSSVFINTSSAYSGSAGDLTFSWNFGNGTTSAVSDPSILYGTGGLKYITLTSTYTNGCADTYTDSVLVSAPFINISASDSDSSICAGDAVTFTLNGEAGSLFQILINGIAQGGFTSATSYPVTTLADGDTVSAEASLNGCIAESSTNYIMNVDPLPVVTLSSSDADQTICTGTSVTFTASGAHKYQFLKNGTAVTVLSAFSTYTTSSLANGDVITVTGIDTTSNCDNVSASLSFTVNSYPSPSVSNNTGTTICSGTAVTFTGSGAALYEYFVNGISQGAATAGSFTTSSLTNGSVITLTGTTNGCTANSSNSYTFTVNPAPATTLTNNTVSNTLCDGETVTFTAGNATIYEFFIDGISQGPASGSNTFSTSTLVNGQVITVSGTQNGCSAFSSSNTMTVNPVPVITLSSSDADNMICLNESVLFTAGGGNTYEFFIGGVSQGITSSAVLTSSAITNGQTVSVKGYNATGCSASAPSSYTFMVLPLPNANFYCSETDLTICEGSNVTFSATGGANYDFMVDGISQQSSSVSTYSTSALPAGNPVVSLSVTGSNGCSITAAVMFTLNVIPLPVISLSSSDADNAICNGDSVTFTASGAMEYQFFISGVSQGGISPANNFSTTSITNGQTVSVTGATGGCSSTGTSTYTFAVTPVPGVNLSSSDIDNIICEGDNITFTSSGASSYEFFLNGISQGASSATSTFSYNNFTDGDEVTVSGSNGGCFAPGNSEYTVSVNPSPVITLSSSDADLEICQGNSITISASGANLYEFFIDGISQGPAGLVNSFTSTVLANGNEVTVSGTSAYGCAGTGIDTLIFTVISLPVITLISSDTDNEICNGEPVDFTATGADTYEFFIDGISTGSPSSINTFTTSSLSNSQQVSVTGSSSGCTASGNDLVFTVYAYPSVSLTSSHTVSQICAGDSVVFTASGSTMYEFFINGISQGAPSTASAFVTTALMTNDTVLVEGINNICASAAPEQFSYTVNAYPVTLLVSSDSDNQICYGESVQFTSSGATTYEFFVNGISQAPPSAATVFSTSALEDNDIISVTGYNGTCASPASTSFSFTVFTMDLQLTSAEQNLICDGESLTYTASGSDLYEFFVNGNSQGAASATSSFTATGLSNGDLVGVSGTSFSTGCVQSSAESFVQVMNVPSITADGPLSFCEGDSVVLSAVGNAYGYQWLLNGMEIDGADESYFVAIESGNYSLLFAQGGNGTLWSAGSNVNGQLGDSSLNASLFPVVIPSLENFVQAESGKEFSIALSSSGSVWVWGYNGFGMLGDGTFTDRFYPYENPAVSGATAVAAGENHSVVLLASGSVVSFGDNTFGQLGNGSNGIANFPVTVSSLTGITAISAGKNHTIALRNDGTVWSWGRNEFGQLGNGTFVNSNLPVQVNGLTNVIAISAGGNHNLAILADSSLYAWGNNSDGQLGTGSVLFSSVPVIVSDQEFISIAAGDVHSIAADRRGNVFSFGNNQDGQLGDGTLISHSAVEQVTGIEDVKNVYAGSYHSFAIRNDGSVYGWGRNINGQTGNGTQTSVSVPERMEEWSGAGSIGAGYDHTIAVMDHGSFCESSSVGVTVNAAPAINIYDNITYLSTDAGDSYQWYYNNNPILGGLAQTQNLIGQGTYFVQVTYSNGCMVTSPVFDYVTGVDDEDHYGLFSVFPNPASENIRITYKGELPAKEIILTDISGRTVRKIQVDELHEFTVNIEVPEMESGLYFLTLLCESKSFTSRLILTDQ